MFGQMTSLTGGGGFQGGSAGPSTATGGYHDSGVSINAGVNMGNGPNPWLIGALALIAAAAYVYTKK
ncbi:MULTISPECIES: hypothetical protein [unclassified Vibrio]|uniref:hypothetical protein n=1 Tax=unclassified Vibrio TaxID=2614977 RepID=UPI001361860B|nr:MULTISPECIES: hypothetical protein [unclassified Vibrio]NAW57764.1 hypothetical protein [Vibrio sp. V36_P2S2PM302]NAX28419.1 hypothetical protein [Vibrio sp. V38_P2S17PM301]NAX29577.1 hypothetical protein [Vibrio sp. V37_P2S8PM304]